jgi:hypothetical protein
MFSLPHLSLLRKHSRRNRTLDLYARTEERIVQLLPDDISFREFSAIDRARSLGLFPMEGGWMAGGYLAKLAMKRIRLNSSDDAKTTQKKVHHARAHELAQGLNQVQASLPAKALLRLRTGMVTRGLIK